MRNFVNMIFSCRAQPAAGLGIAFLNGRVFKAILKEYKSFFYYFKIDYDYKACLCIFQNCLALHSVALLRIRIDQHCLALSLLRIIIAQHFLELALGLIISLLRQLGLNSMFSLVFIENGLECPKNDWKLSFKAPIITFE